VVERVPRSGRRPSKTTSTPLREKLGTERLAGFERWLTRVVRVNWCSQ
jgi:hypothetical protein